jgi:glycosyltransferase involved in cell wall biosynthesis
VLRRLLRAPGLRGIVAISGALADDLVEHLDVPRERIHVAHDGVRLLPDVPANERRTSGAPLRVGYTGSLYPGKGGGRLLPLAAACPWAEFTVAGGPPGVADALRDSAAQQGIGNLTVLGPLEPTEARALQQRCDVLIAPFARRIESDSGVDIARWTSPLKVFEYMASGRPIVISDLPVLREVLRPDVDALMVEPEDAEALIGALRRLADDPALGERLAASALERAHAEFTWEARARGILERFARVAR